MVTVLPGLIVKMRNCGVPAALLRSTVSRFAPGPVIVRFLSITRSAVVSVIGLVTVFPKVIVLPSQASIMACLSDPAPLSPLLVTTGLVVQVTALTADGRPGIRATAADSTTASRTRRDRKEIRHAT